MSNENNQEISKDNSHELENDHKDGNWNFFLAIVLISVVGFAAIVMLQENNIITDPKDQILTPQQDGDEFVISISDLSTEANLYAYNDDDVVIKFFAVIGSDNEVHIAFDACDVCFSEKQGYRQNDVLMICNNCGNQFLITGIGTENVQGGCWPSYLPITVADGEVHIEIADVELKKYMFE
ncbi:MAG: Fe-S-containing protein [Candidatus Hodarchaeales archaeon]